MSDNIYGVKAIREQHIDGTERVIPASLLGEPVRMCKTNNQGEQNMTKEEALQLAAQAWCQPTTSNKVMDPVLATAFADILMRLAPPSAPAADATK